MKGITSIFPIIHLAFSFRQRIKEIIEWIIKQSQPTSEAQVYLRNHGLKTALWIGVFHKIAHSLGITASSNVELAYFCISIIWANLDKILDTLPSWDTRFATIVRYFTEVLTTGETDTCLPLQHPKFTELTILAKCFHSSICELPRKWEIIQLVTDLSLAVNEQRDSNPRDILDEEEDIYWDIKNKIRSSNISPQTQKDMFLAARLWITSVLLSFGISLYSVTRLSEKQSIFLRTLIFHAAYMQFLDDFLDREKDWEQQIFTYATQCSEEELHKIEVLLTEWRKELEQSLQKISSPASNILLHGMRTYSLLNRFWPKDTTKKNPYGIPLR